MNDNVRNTILGISASSCNEAAKLLRMAADKADSAAAYCKAHQIHGLDAGVSLRCGRFSLCLGKVNR